MQNLAKTVLVGGLACGLACFTIHLVSGNSVTIPISVEYAKLNPLAILFVWTSLFLLGSASYLYYRLHRLLEAIINSIGTVGMFVVALTEMESGTHELALVFAVGSLVLAPTLSSMRGEIDLQDILLIAVNLSLSLMLVVLAIFHPRTFGLGMAERGWFFLGFLSTVWVLDIPGMATRESREISN